MARDYSASEQAQKELYDSLAGDYSQHYGDEWSQKYRRRFINEPMLGPVDLQGKRVLDAICGSGESTGYLLEKGAEVTGLDISEKEMLQFEQSWPQCRTHYASILNTGLPDNSFDCVVVVSGLHHVHPHVPDAIREIHRLLVPGGYFCFTEPHTGSLPDVARRLWYRHDDFFADNEAAIDLDGLKLEFGHEFEVCAQKYTGNVGHLFVLQSLVLGLPLRWKRYYAPVMLALEGVIEKLQGKRLGCFAVCRWQKK